MAVFNAESATVKTRHALAHAQAMARELGHPEITSTHLFTATMQQDDGLARPLLERAGVHGAAIDRLLQQHLAKMPKVQGSDVRPSRELGESLGLTLHDQGLAAQKR